MIQQDSSHPTGVTGPPNSSKELSHARNRKADAALALKGGGASWSEIAEIVGYPSERAALVAVEGALTRQLTELDRDKLRQLASNRLESLLRSTWRKAHDEADPEHLVAVGRSREVVDRWIKLNGLDRPTEVIIATPTQEELDRWVARIVSTDLPDVVEYDVVEGEVVDSEESA